MSPSKTLGVVLELGRDPRLASAAPRDARGCSAGLLYSNNEGAIWWPGWDGDASAMRGCGSRPKEEWARMAPKL